jgi:hypothetical protein
MMGTEQAFETLGVSTSLMVLTLPEQFSEVAELHGIQHAAQTNGLRECKSGEIYHEILVSVTEVTKLSNNLK